MASKAIEFAEDGGSAFRIHSSIREFSPITTYTPIEPTEIPAFLIKVKWCVLVIRFAAIEHVFLGSNMQQNTANQKNYSCI
jgi:hypothetical protein